MQPRESRREVVIPAQMRSKRGWSDVTIRNISPHGMMLLAPFPPRPGTYVEVRRASLAMVGRVVWVKGKTLGIQLIERLNFNALLRAANETLAISSNRTARNNEPQVPAPALPADTSPGIFQSWLRAGIDLIRGQSRRDTATADLTEAS
ncbi:PilZ domain-containing protein [Sphingomonas sp. OTU376]|uniref:PilZ domain-containing protein n=1 Tax=Sphingomonas sp. OTU376 TaxID=3043863 RepID=UPI00313DEAC4